MCARCGQQNAWEGGGPEAEAQSAACADAMRAAEGVGEHGPKTEAIGGKVCAVRVAADGMGGGWSRDKRCKRVRCGQRNG